MDDEPINRRIVIRILENLGYLPESAANGTVAIEQHGAARYDAILMDCVMPELDGYQATAMLRARELPSHARVPVIAMTAHAMPGARERCLEAGMDDYLTKPVRPDRLREVLSQWLPAHERRHP